MHKHFYSALETLVLRFADPVKRASHLQPRAPRNRRSAIRVLRKDQGRKAGTSDLPVRIGLP